MRTPSLLARLFVTMVCTLVVAWFAFGPVDVPEAAAQQPQLPKTFVGAGACSECHDAKETTRFPKDFVLLNESAIWSKQDKHSQAYEVLKWERSQQMGELMGIADVTKDVRCLSCHAVVATEDQQGQFFSVEDGVSCDACHGPSGLWLSAHWTVKGWRKFPSAQKAAFGMIDVRDPVLRAKMCLSCHVGNTEEGKVVTHEMYAAGHPPLPGFEIETFVNHEPKHWRYLEEKSPEIQKEFNYNPEVEHRTELVILGGLLSLRESIALFGSQAKKLQSQWPELAQFDCYACHHDLSKPNNSWRLARGFESWRLLENSTVPPGRPQMREWTSVLAVLALMHAGQSEEQIVTALAPLHDALAAQPYGNHETVSEAAAKVVAWIDEQVNALSSESFKKEGAENILRLIAKMATDADHVLDFDSARQLAWAYQIIYRELHPEVAPPVKEVFDQLTEQLKLNLPSGHEQQILQELPATLEKISTHDPGAVRKLFEQLGKAAKS